jgi:hypothetical protein
MLQADAPAAVPVQHRGRWPESLLSVVCHRAGARSESTHTCLPGATPSGAQASSARTWSVITTAVWRLASQRIGVGVVCAAFGRWPLAGRAGRGELAKGARDGLRRCELCKQFWFRATRLWSWSAAGGFVTRARPPDPCLNAQTRPTTPVETLRHAPTRRHPPT